MNQSTSGPLPGRNRRAAGFSLAEVLVAVALLAVILLALMGLISSGVHRAYSGKKMTEATMLAQAAMERANVYAAHKLLGAADSDTTATQTWTRKGTDTTPAPVSGTSADAIEQTAWHDLLDNANLPTDASFPSTLTVTMTPMGAPPSTTANFGNASMIRVVVDVTWTEWGSRQRQVRLQTLNLRKVPE